MTSSAEDPSLAPAGLSYAVVTPVRNEAPNLPRLAKCLEAQTVRPLCWIIVDNGSDDATVPVSQELTRRHSWIRLERTTGADQPTRGGPVVRAFQAGLAALPQPPEIVVKLDADVSLDADHFERLLAAFDDDPSLCIAGGTVFELRGEEWIQLHATRTSVRGAARAYRWSCLADVLPLEERMGWDGIDEFKANSRGWTTRTLVDLPVRHHRRRGERDASRLSLWKDQGGVAHYMDYRPSYLLLRAIFRAYREPAALAMLWGYGAAALRREERCSDAGARAYLRDGQRLRELPTRAREAFGRTHALRDGDRQRSG